VLSVRVKLDGAFIIPVEDIFHARSEGSLQSQIDRVVDDIIAPAMTNVNAERVISTNFDLCELLFLKRDQTSMEITYSILNKNASNLKAKVSIRH
jgi:hypothetical protein